MEGRFLKPKAAGVLRLHVPGALIRAFDGALRQGHAHLQLKALQLLLPLQVSEPPSL